MFGVHNQSKDRHLYIFIISTYRLGMATSCVCVRNLWLGVISMSIAHLHKTYCYVLLTQAQVIVVCLKLVYRFVGIYCRFG